MNKFWDSLAQLLSQKSGRPFKLVSAKSISGGDINSAYKLYGEDVTYFVKLNQKQHAHMFESESQALLEAMSTKSIRVPKPVLHGELQNQAFLVLEWLDIGGRGSWLEFGKQLGKMHQACAESFGWHRDNTIGTTPQINQLSKDWVDFYISNRLQPQFKMARTKGYQSKFENELLKRVPSYFQNYKAKASFLHGDLWGGNASFTQQGEPVIFDLASYHGDLETDLAMTELFGGFPEDFYVGYRKVQPVDDGYEKRKTLYNLYHILNHYNLFGGSYGLQADSMIDRLLKD